MEFSKHNFKKIVTDLLGYEEIADYDFTLPKTGEELSGESNTSSSDAEEDTTLKPLQDIKESVYPNIDVNLEYINVKYNTLINTDIKIREFTFMAKGKQYRAFILFIDGMVDSKSISDFVLKPLMLNNKDNNPQKEMPSGVPSRITIKKVKKFNLVDYIYNSLIVQNDAKKSTEFSEVISSVNSGDCALFIDTLDTAFILEVKGFQQRSINPPSNEVVIRGSQEAFVENLRTNTSLIRRITNNENLVIENIDVGVISNTKCAICYIKGIANNDLISEVKYRINNLDIDYLLSSGQLQQLIEDNGKFSLPGIISSERPDRSANYLLDGRVVVLVNGSPFSLIMPATFSDFIHSMEDSNLKFQYTNLLKILRLFALAVSLLLPGLYIAITSFHQELIPTELLFAVVASRASVPFPIIFEIIIMEASFELIREAGVRVPSAAGPTIGIVGGLILGDAAVSANIVSPILIIVVAITGISSFAVPDFYLGFHFRIVRFLFIILGYLAGFLGIAIGLFSYFAILSSITSFGVPYLSPYSSFFKHNGHGYFEIPIWKREIRPDTLNSKRTRKEKDISMAWRKRGNNI